MNPELTQEQQQALERNHGLVEGSSYVLMSIDVYRRKIQGQSEHIDLTEVGGEAQNGGNAWSEEKNERRCDLIDKEIEGTITDDEKRELDVLQREAAAYRDRVAPVPTEGAKELHRELLAAKRRKR